jgi:hypothetical protein
VSILKSSRPRIAAIYKVALHRGHPFLQEIEYHQIRRILLPDFLPKYLVEIYIEISKKKAKFLFAPADFQSLLAI